MMDKETITVVSGLPRSGTSMMMKMLQAGGLEPLTDHVRKADEDNPGGYFEFERVKKVKEDATWLAAARGRAVKVISRLLYDLPADYQYKVIFMQRDMAEVLASQKAMLVRRGQEGDPVDDAEMAQVFAKHLVELETWLGTQKHFQVLYVDYNQALKTPLDTGCKVERFLGLGLEVVRMAEVVDENLHRQRRG